MIKEQKIVIHMQLNLKFGKLWPQRRVIFKIINPPSIVHHIYYE